MGKADELTARIVPYPWQDDTPGLFVECLACGIEWAWCRETPEAYEKLQGYADNHNDREHKA